MDEPDSGATEPAAHDGTNTATTNIAAVAREVDEFVATAGWDQPPQLFALVPTADLLAKQPELADRLDVESPLTPVAQESLPESDLGDALAKIAWPDTVAGCALAHEIVVLPPGAEPELEEAAGESGDVERLQRAAANHPERTEARLVAAVSRDGARACVMRLRGKAENAASEPVDEVIEHPDLAPNLLDALATTLEP
ncbi:PPA1309 family protein [Haloechinothrix salitolerans]|uniref:PPA1309 family protein n=1 Tax=Haloechinothrix salitolerans TaxID=926830 RepID=A0ABW2C8X2_9PSEU